MRPVWLAVLAARPPDAGASATLHDSCGDAAGWLVLWRGEAAADHRALKADPRILDPDGEEGWISLVLVDRVQRPAFDDTAVQQARRSILAGPAPDLVSTLLADDSRFAGSLTLRRGAGARRLLRDDPFGRVRPARLLRVGPGVLGSVAASPGPTIERHGSGVPWPGGRFSPR